MEKQAASNPLVPIEANFPSDKLMQLERLFDSIDHPVWLADKDFCIQYANKASEVLFQLAPDRMMEKPCWEVVHGIGAPEWLLIKASQTGKRTSTEIQLAESWFNAAVNPIFDESGLLAGYATILSDITAIKNTENKLRKSEKQLRAILEASTESLFLMDTSGQVMLANSITAERLKTDMNTLKEGNILDVLPPDVANNRTKHIRNVIETRKPFQFEDEPFEWMLLNEEEKEKLIMDLQNALSQIKVLSGMLPICASCKKIRNDEGYWQQIESYIKDHSEAQFSLAFVPNAWQSSTPISNLNNPVQDEQGGSTIKRVHFFLIR
jgi:PAS domain S-box-containing protein